MAGPTDDFNKIQGFQSPDLRKPLPTLEDYLDDPLVINSSNSKHLFKNEEFDFTTPKFGVTTEESAPLSAEELADNNEFAGIFNWVSSLFGVSNVPPTVHGVNVRVALIDKDVKSVSKSGGKRKGETGIVTTFCTVDQTLFTNETAIAPNTVVKVQYLDKNLTQAKIIGIANYQNSMRKDLLEEAAANAGSNNNGDNASGSVGGGSGASGAPPGDEVRLSCVNPKYAGAVESQGIQVTRNARIEGVINKQIGDLYFTLQDFIPKEKITLPAAANQVIKSTSCWRNVSIGTTWHQGADIGMACGGDLFAVADGEVVSVNSFVADGKKVACRSKPTGILTTKHISEIAAHGVPAGSPLYFRYIHILGTPPGIKVGAKITKGQVIAYAGGTGDYGPHLHLDFSLQQEQVRGVGKAGVGPKTDPTAKVKINAFLTPN